jgi:hypothetical protein
MSAVCRQAAAWLRTLCSYSSVKDDAAAAESVLPMGSMLRVLRTLIDAPGERPARDVDHACAALRHSRVFGCARLAAAAACLCSWGQACARTSTAIGTRVR